MPATCRPSRVFDFDMTCPLMVAGNCTFLGIFDAEPDARGEPTLRGIAELDGEPTRTGDAGRAACEWRRPDHTRSTTTIARRRIGRRRDRASSSCRRQVFVSS